MPRNDCRKRRVSVAAAGCVAIISLTGCHSGGPSEFVQYSSIRESIGHQDHVGRVSLESFSPEQHFYAVGALEALDGEVTVIDSEVVVTSASPDACEPLAPAGRRAAFLAGQEVSEWTRVAVEDNVASDGFEAWLAREVADAGLAESTPFVFVIEGELQGVRLHVIRGACPVHARMHGITLDAEHTPLVQQRDRLAGVLVGVYAPDSVGQLTHPDSSTHAHVVFVDPATGERVTGHLEHTGVMSGAELRLPALEHSLERGSGGQKPRTLVPPARTGSRSVSLVW